MPTKLTTRQEARDHPSAEQWMRFLTASIPQGQTRRLAEHLSACVDCQELLARLPTSTNVVLGRPLLGNIGRSPIEVVRHVNALEAALARRTGLVTVSGPWHSETLITQVVAATIERLNDRGKHRARVAGPVRSSAAAPPPPPGTAVVLLDAPVYDDWERWRDLREHKVVVLTAEDVEWRRLGVVPNLYIEDKLLSEVVHPYQVKINNALKHGPLEMKAGILANALGIDWPAQVLETFLQNDAMASPFLPVGVGGLARGWLSVESPWLARQCLRARTAVMLEPSLELAAIAEVVPSASLPWLQRRWAHVITTN